MGGGEKNNNNPKVMLMTQQHKLCEEWAKTHGAKFTEAQVIYSAKIKPGITFGSQIWAEKGIKLEIPEKIIKPLRKI